jgi:hypothetical protein
LGYGVGGRGLVFGDFGSGIRDLGFGVGVWGWEFGVWGVRFRGVGFGVCGLWCGWGLGFTRKPIWIGAGRCCRMCAPAFVRGVLERYTFHGKFIVMAI